MGTETADGIFTAEFVRTERTDLTLLRGSGAAVGKSGCAGDYLLCEDAGWELVDRIRNRMWQRQGDVDL